MRRIEVYEIIEKFEKAKSKKARIEVLHEYKDAWALRDVLRATFDDSLQFNLPEGKPPFEANREESTPSSLHKRHKDIGWFVKGFKGDNLPSFKREQKFIQLLESIHPKDADLICRMKDKDLQVKYLTKKLVQEALPDLIPE
jgi:hypothetical protein